MSVMPISRRRNRSASRWVPPRKGQSGLHGHPVLKRVLAFSNAFLLDSTHSWLCGNFVPTHGRVALHPHVRLTFYRFPFCCLGINLGCTVVTFCPLHHPALGLASTTLSNRNAVSKARSCFKGHQAGVTRVTASTLSSSRKLDKH